MCLVVVGRIQMALGKKWKFMEIYEAAAGNRLPNEKNAV